jgi:predicted MFS family arabinose efflux permease
MSVNSINVNAKLHIGNMIKWLVLALSVGCYLMGFVVRFAWPPMIVVAAPDLGIDMARAGMYMSAFYIGYVLTHIPAGVLADRFGVRYLLFGAMLLEGVSSLAMAHIGSFSPGFWLRIVGGLGAGTVYAACVRSVTTWFSAKERGMAFGIMMLSPTAGVLLANQIVPYMVDRFAWQTAFSLVGWLAIGLAVLVLFTMKETGARAEGKSFLEGLRFVFGHRDLMLMAFAGFALLWIQVGFISWGNAALKHFGYSLAQAGLAMTLFGVGGILGPIVSGFLADRTANKKALVIIGYLAMIPLVLAFGYLKGFGILAAIACALGFLNGYANTFVPLIVSQYSGEEWAASAGGVTGSIFQIASILGPFVLGLSIDVTGSFSTVWWLLAVAPLGGVVLLLFMRKPASEKPEGSTSPRLAGSSTGVARGSQ